MQVVVLAGGLGTRLRPVTEKIPKVMIEVGGKPFLEHQLEFFKQRGIREFLFLPCYLNEEVRDYFGLGEKWGVRIDYSCEPEPLGTGGALKFAASKLKERFLLINGDTFFPIDIDAFIQKTDEIADGGLIAVYDNSERVAPNNIRVEKDGTVSKYSRHSEAGMNGVDGGLSFYCKSVLKQIPKEKKVSLEEEIYPLLIRQRLLKAHFTTERYYDMGTFERLEIAQRRFFTKHP